MAPNQVRALILTFAALVLTSTKSFAAPTAAPAKKDAKNNNADINVPLRQFTDEVVAFKAANPKATDDEVTAAAGLAAKRAKLPISDARVAEIIAAALLKPETETADGGPPRKTPENTPINATTPPDQSSVKPQLSLGQQVVNAVDGLNVIAHPGDPGPLKRRGLDLNFEQNWRGSYDDLRQVVEHGSPDAQTLTAFGGDAFRLGDYQTATTAALLALKMDPNNAEAMAIYQFSKGRSPAVSLPSPFAMGGNEPLGAASGGPRSDQPGATSQAGFASAPARTGMTAEQAAALAREAAPAGPDAAVRSGQFTKDSASAMRVRDYEKAYQLASQAITLNPNNAQALNFRAMSLGQMRRYSDSVQDASAALSLAPGNAAILHTRSWAFSKQGKYKEALEDAQAASATEPSNAFLYQDKAYALAGLGDRPAALDALRRSAELDPRFTARLERAIQLPQNSDMTLLFDDGTAAPVVLAAAAPGSRGRKFARLAVLSATGGLLIALGVLHIVSASWREKMRLTVRRVLGPAPASSGGDKVAAADAAGSGAFWTQYELIKEIGLGGMGVVYEAIDRSLERRVAVKKMRDEIRLEPHDRQRFIAEARMVAQLHHPAIVDIYGIVEDSTDVYLVFEFVEGRTLQDALKSDGPMDVPRAARVLRDMAAAVAHAHERGIIHRDLKPSNVMLTPEDRVKVMDFGIARQAKDSMTRHSMTNNIVGTPPYMAPEQEQGTVRKESDVYALGVCLYEMTTGHLPFSGSGAAMLLNKLNGKLIPPSQRLPTLPPGLDPVIAKALAPDPEKRYHTPAELTTALDELTSVDLAS
jgi:tetratricopeptide (TPR) repeat protein